jgi:amidohydrolase
MARLKKSSESVSYKRLSKRGPMNSKTKELVALRKKLHRLAETADGEKETAAFIRSFLESYDPDDVISGIGGHGLAAVYRGKKDGPTVLVRSELDALPIPETLSLDYASEQDGRSHKCGHDGHMSMVSGLAPLLHGRPPERGAVILMYQPAEETGQGARRVLDDPKYSQLAPDYVFALHNLPGFPMGQVVLVDGTFASASQGLIVELKGTTSHAAEPNRGRSPALAAAQLIQGLTAMPQSCTAMHEAALVTVIHARVGERAFGTTPGEGVVMATLRTHTPGTMDLLSGKCVGFAKAVAEAYGLACSIGWTEAFPATINDPECVRLVETAAHARGIATLRHDVPFGWSEDFGHFTDSAKGALFGLGAGENHPALHNPDYDFPDELIPIGVGLFEGILRRLTGPAD